MPTLLTYKGYSATVEYRPDDQILFGQVLDLSDTVVFEARSSDEVEASFHGAVDDYLAFCEEMGDAPEKPFSGKFNVRMDPAEHRAATVAAARAGESLNTFVTLAVGNRVRSVAG